MSPKEYYIGIIAIIFAFTLSKFLEGIIDFLTKRKIIDGFFTHKIWIVVCILGIFQYIWGVFPTMNEYIDRHFGYFLLFSVPVMTIQIVSYILFPKVDEKEYREDRKFKLKEYAENNKKIFYSIIAFWILYLQVVAIVFSTPLESALTTAMRFVLLSMLLVGIVNKNNNFPSDLIISFSHLVIVILFICIKASVAYTDCKVKITSISFENNQLIRNNCILLVNDDSNDVFL